MRGGGGLTAVYANGKLYTRDYASSPPDQIFDAQSGAQLGSFGPSAIPAFSSTAGFFLTSDPQTNVSTLTAVDQTNGSSLWTFQGDGDLATAPIVIDGVVVVASSSGNVYALNASTGAVVWSGSYRHGDQRARRAERRSADGPRCGRRLARGTAGNSIVAWKIVP